MQIEIVINYPTDKISDASEQADYISDLIERLYRYEGVTVEKWTIDAES